MGFQNQQQTPPQSLTAAVVSPLKTTFFGLSLVSGVVNILALTSPLFMLQIYDRVLASGSLPTLVGLALLALGLYGFQCLLDIIRARVLIRIGEDFDLRYCRRVHDAVVRLPLVNRMPGDGLQPLRDLDNVRGFLSGTGPTAFFDLPWMPLYLGICFLFHFWIGVTALAGAILLVSLTILTNIFSQKPIRDTMVENMARNRRLEASRRNAEVVQAMGLGGRLGKRWQNSNEAYLAANRKAGDVAGGLGNIAKSLRVVLQSAILAVGAWLVINQEASGGVMIASSIMMGRALAPVDLAIAYVEELLSAFDHDPPHIWASPEGGWLELGQWEAHAWRIRVAAWAEVYARVAAGAPVEGDLDVVHQHACEANYGDPVYGGNADRRGWVRVGFPSPMYPPGWRAS